MGNYIKIGFLVIALALIALTSYFWYQSRDPTILPKAPSNLTAKSLSAIQIKITWKDNSNNELGFRVYRDRVLIADLKENATKFEDVNLRPATNYEYKIEAYNLVGKSDFVAGFIKTLNPPITIWIDKIGVHENGEEGELLRELGRGEVYAGLIVKDNKTTVQKNLPKKGHYSLNRDEAILVGEKVFETKEVGENIRMVVISYEDDGGFGEQVIYKALDMAAKSYIGGPTSILFSLAGIDFTQIFADIFGAADDWLGTYVAEWTIDNNWGVGNYNDVQCKKKDGNIGLRLWFRVECPVYDYALNK